MGILWDCFQSDIFKGKRNENCSNVLWRLRGTKQKCNLIKSVFRRIRGSFSLYFYFRRSSVVLCCVKRVTYDSCKMRKGLLTWVFWAKIPLGGWKGYVTDEWGNYAYVRVIWITVWVVSKNESICLLENKMVSPLIWRHVRLL